MLCLNFIIKAPTPPIAEKVGCQSQYLQCGGNFCLQLPRDRLTKAVAAGHTKCLEKIIAAHMLLFLNHLHSSVVESAGRVSCL